MQPYYQFLFLLDHPKCEITIEMSDVRAHVSKLSLNYQPIIIMVVVVMVMKAFISSSLFNNQWRTEL